MTQHDQDTAAGSRHGFTLVELLVVIFIIAVIAGLAAFFMPGFGDRERTAQGAQDLHGWLLMARQTALRDQAPRGVRLFPDPSDTNNPPIFYSKAQFLEQPDDFTGGTLQSAGVNNSSTTVLTYANVDPTGGFASDATQATWPVQNGDAIQFHGSGLMHRISSIDPVASTITLASPLPFAISQKQANYKIVRKPRLQGDEPMDMPADIAIDISTNTIATNPAWVKPFVRNADNTLNIMFAPNGSVIFNTGTDKMIFWVRDIGQPLTLANGIYPSSPSLIAIYTQSGFVGGFEVAQPPQFNNPYFNVK